METRGREERERGVMEMGELVDFFFEEIVRIKQIK